MSKEEIQTDVQTRYQQSLEGFW